MRAEAVDHSWRDWGVDGDWIWEDDGAKPATTTSSRVAAVVDDPSSMGIYITRWSAKRLREIANTVKGKKRDVISKSSFGDLLHISPLPPPPEALVDFIVMRIDTKKRLLKLTDRKKISLTRDLWDEHILLDAMREVKKYQDKRNEGKLKFHIGGCLPMLPVIYMDHIDIPRGCIVDHSIDYSLPRACFVKELDFTAVIAVDTMEDGFGKRPFSSTTPYATTKFLSYIEQVAQLPNIASVSAIENPVNRDADGAEQPTESDTNEADGRARNVHEPPPKNMGGGDDVCGSLEDWLHPLPTFEDSELPPHMRAIFNKHKDIHALRNLKRLSDEIRVQVTLQAAQCTFTDLKLRKEASQLIDTNSVETKVLVGKRDFAHQPHKSKSKLNSGIDFSNAKGEDICSEANKFERMSPRSTSYPCGNLIRRPGTLEDGPSFGLFEPGSPDALLFQDVPQVESPPRSPDVDIESFMEIREGSPKFDNLFAAATSPGPVYDVTHLRGSRQYQLALQVVSIFHSNISSGLKKRAHVNNEVMSLYIESFNIEHMYNSSKPRKFAFSPHVATKLSVDPSSFNPNSCNKDFKRACEKNDIAKCDQTQPLLNFRKYIAAKLFKHPQNTLSSEEELQKLLKKS
ncbi:hypothetical protein ZWY2020_021393 [Hordeum vulgare]|nr:hypothetical protein ZWY2020_021393 [Hordeum vulgare]